MLAHLSIRDIVLIDRLDLPLRPGMTVLTGETGAGKSILLDALGLALGARGDSGLVRQGAEQGVVTAQIDLPADHEIADMLGGHGIDVDGEVLLRRVQLADGRSRAFINDQPVSVALLRQAGAMLAEIHGQHDDRAFLDRDSHARLLDAYGQLDGDCANVETLWTAWGEAREALDDHRARIAKAAEERDYLAHAIDELQTLAPEQGEEATLAERRQAMMNAEKFADDLKEAERALNGDGTLEASIAGALRRLERKRDDAGGMLDKICAAMERVVVELGEARAAVADTQRLVDFDAADLERAEERLFALRAAGRKYQVQPDDLSLLLERFLQDVGLIDDNEIQTKRLAEACDAAREAYLSAAQALSAKRVSAAHDLDAKVAQELAPLKLERARFETMIEHLAPEQAGPRGLDRVEFTVATNPGTAPGPLMKIASGGELARFILALKVVLAAKGSAPTLVFDEVDTAVGGAVADAIGVRLERLAATLQVLTVTHSPQVAARAGEHVLIAKREIDDSADAEIRTHARTLDEPERREEVARMLSGQQVTDEARAAAERLMQKTG